MAKMTVDQRVAFMKLLDELRGKWSSLKGESYEERNLRREAVRAKLGEELGMGQAEAEVSKCETALTAARVKVRVLEARVEAGARDDDAIHQREETALDLAYQTVRNAVIAIEDAESAQKKIDAFIGEIQSALAA